MIIQFPFKSRQRTAFSSLLIQHILLINNLYLRGGQHAVQCWGRSQFRPDAQPRDNWKVI